VLINVHITRVARSPDGALTHAYPIVYPKGRAPDAPAHRGGGGRLGGWSQGPGCAAPEAICVNV